MTVTLGEHAAYSPSVAGIRRWGGRGRGLGQPGRAASVLFRDLVISPVLEF